MICGVGFMPGSYTGRTRIPVSMGYATGSPAHGLGDISPSMIQLAEDSGIYPGDIDLLNSVGATDQDIEALINGNVTLTDLYAQFGVTIPSHPAVQSPPPPTPISTVGLPAGSTSTYTASWNAAGGSLPQGAIQSLQQNLPNHNLIVTGANVTGMGLLGPASIQLSIQNTVGFAQPYDAQSIIDSLLNSYLGAGSLVGTSLLSSSLVPVSAPPPAPKPGTTLPSATTTPRSAGPTATFPLAASLLPTSGISGVEGWLSTNKSLVIGALLIVFVGPPLFNALGSFGRRRR